ncbi:MAG TPA: hypothetical protein VI731_04230 [Bacteroidia bacterium]|nr:hypothetical protein [Bacteroidia bacterium]
MKTNPLSRLFVLAALVLFFLFTACQGTKTADTTRRPVDPLLANDVPFQEFTVSADHGDTIRLSGGTNIYIPAGIFVDAVGAPVKGDVRLHYRAFYTPGEVIASGITMFYDTAGAEHVFTSAGMFEMNGTQDEKPVSIAPGKSISMDFASSYNDMPFNFYNLDTSNGMWNYITTTTASANLLKQELLSAFESAPVRPAEPQQYNSKFPVIDLDINVADHPELAGYAGLLWQYGGTGNDPEKNAHVYKTEWTSAKLEMIDTSVCVYDLTLSAGAERFTTTVKPVLKGNDYENAMVSFRKKMEEFGEAEKIRQEKRQEAANTQEFVRPLSVSSFGFYNCDALFGLGEVLFTRCEFHFDDPEFEANREKVAVYFSVANGRMVSGYNGASVPRMGYVRDFKTCMVAILPGTNKACVLPANEFLPVDDGLVRKVKLRFIDSPVTTAADVNDVLAKL